ncbi:hypothetical protein [Streptomyces ipomoeae]|uniref:hypothetical protein n=1 Tax=Streptomyces ipomoeae TaxID=103232 RepID=UPI0015F09173|nr:hypothetical protein [Streptomyces ipomoeae]MDX2931191.1 hypothetical protein [Streptomyces ipomoeae]
MTATPTRLTAVRHPLPYGTGRQAPLSYDRRRQAPRCRTTAVAVRIHSRTAW